MVEDHRRAALQVDRIEAENAADDGGVVIGHQHRDAAARGWIDARPGPGHADSHIRVRDAVGAILDIGDDLRCGDRGWFVGTMKR